MAWPITSQVSGATPTTAESAEETRSPRERNCGEERTNGISLGSSFCLHLSPATSLGLLLRDSGQGSQVNVLSGGLGFVLRLTHMAEASDTYFPLAPFVSVAAGIDIASQIRPAIAATVGVSYLGDLFGWNPPDHGIDYSAINLGATYLYNGGDRHLLGPRLDFVVASRLLPHLSVSYLRDLTQPDSMLHVGIYFEFSSAFRPSRGYGTGLLN